MNYKIILWDIDNTLLSFVAAEYVAIKRCFETHRLGQCTDEMIEKYSVINRGYWEMLEREEIEKSELMVRRFEDFFALYGIDKTLDGNPVDRQLVTHFNDEYQVRLGETCVFFDDGYELVKKLKDLGFRQYAVTNGSLTAQRLKLKNSGLVDLLDGAFISDEIGIEKPMKGFFDAAFSQIEDCSPEEMLIVGDSLTSDMRGGNNAKVDTCWYNPNHKTNTEGVKLNYEIDNLWQLLTILNLN